MLKGKRGIPGFLNDTTTRATIDLRRIRCCKVFFDRLAEFIRIEIEVKAPDTVDLMTGHQYRSLRGKLSALLYGEPQPHPKIKYDTGETEWLDIADSIIEVIKKFATEGRELDPVSPEAFRALRKKILNRADAYASARE